MHQVKIKTSPEYWLSCAEQVLRKAEMKLVNPFVAEMQARKYVRMAYTKQDSF